MVDSGYPNEEYAKFDGKTDERAGYCRPDPECNNSEIKRLIYNMPSNYKGKTIIKAEFQVSLARGWNDTARDIMIYQMSGAASASTNWNNMPSWSTHLQTRSVGAEQSCKSTTRNTVFEVTNAIKDAVTKNRTSTTFGIRAENESNKEHWKRFCSNALLRVNWNRAPAKPATTDLSMSPGGACLSGTGRPYVDTPPRLSAVLRDPDHLTGNVSEPVSGQFRVRWTPPGGTQQQLLYTTGKKASGSRFDYTVPKTIPQNVTVLWDVRTSDGTIYGPWSSDGGPPPCEFIYDATTPSAPKVKSAEYLEDRLIDCATYSNATWRNGVGVQSTFTFDSDSTDVVEYQYGINTNPSPANVLRPATDGGPVTMVYLPQEEGVMFITVLARDRANKTSAIANCSFRVGAGAKAIAEWQMADDAAAEEAADAAAEGRDVGGAPAIKHGEGVEFGVAGPGGASDRAVSLPGPGAGAGYLETAETEIVNTQRSFGVSAWVKLDELGRSQTVVSQDGAGQAGFTLGYDAGRAAWEFGFPTTDVNSLGRWTVVGGTVEAGRWTHLVGMFDQQAGTIAILVDGVRTESQRRSRLAARGAVQIGRHLELGTYTNYLNGDVADVSLFNRVVVPNEGGPISEVKATRKGYWPVDTAPGGVSPEHRAGQPLTLGGGAVLGVDDPFGDPPSIPMLGAGELRLDGVDDYAATASAPVPTDHSFSVVARVRVASIDPGQPQAVLSQPGAHTSAFVVRRNAANRWELMMTKTDTVGADKVTAYDSEAEQTDELWGQQVALTYNAFTNEVKLYVDGQPTVTGKAVNGAAWNASGGLQVGRAFLDGVWAEYFNGAVDEIRTYSGVLDATTVQLLNQPGDGQVDL
ncbi:hypothetical protein Asi02nite_28900 [Asanoa siamensis]|uniref:LamG-like jellyroll fold domain-containing protein n=2 Tax=Asanoa siamensis TaxID=926357 RepID=A0ABQ4CR89_9ACTN|nr:hypothetical protein Asi02nite_28900 [Asanoa siamensis]